MKRSLSIIAVCSVLLLTAGTVAAQNGTPAADPSGAFDVSGEVLSFTAGSRSGMPLLVVYDETIGGEVSVALGPAWFLQKAGFSVLVGDYVTLVAFPCATCAAENVAKWVNNDTNGTSVDLRGDDGVPLWQGGYRGSPDDAHGGTGDRRRIPSHGDSGQGTRTGGTSGLDMTTVTTVTGTVEAIREATGTGDDPHLLLRVDGNVLKIHFTAGAYNLLDAAGVVIELEDELTVTYALTKCSDPAMVALSIIDPDTGLVVQLRDPETGFPIMGGMRGNPR